MRTKVSDDGCFTSEARHNTAPHILSRASTVAVFIFAATLLGAAPAFADATGQGDLVPSGCIRSCSRAVFGLPNSGRPSGWSPYGSLASSPALKRCGAWRRMRD